MQKVGQDVWSRTDYILGKDCRLFQEMDVRYTRNHSDHYMELGCLMGDPAKELTGYLRKACRSPLRPLYRDLVSEPEKLFSDLSTLIPKPPLCERVMRSCISDKTWTAIDIRLTARREGDQKTVR